MKIIINLPPAHGHVGCLFLIFCVHFIALIIILRALSLCIFTKISRSTINFKTENGPRFITEYYAFTIIRVDQVNFLREKFGVSAYSRISTVVNDQEQVAQFVRRGVAWRGVAWRSVA